MLPDERRSHVCLPTTAGRPAVIRSLGPGIFPSQPLYKGMKSRRRSDRDWRPVPEPSDADTSPCSTRSARDAVVCCCLDKTELVCAGYNMSCRCASPVATVLRPTGPGFPDRLCVPEFRKSLEGGPLVAAGCLSRASSPLHEPSYRAPWLHHSLLSRNPQ